MHEWFTYTCTFPFHLADLAELNLPKTCEIRFSDKDDLLNFKLIITPDEVSLYLKKVSIRTTHNIIKLCAKCVIINNVNSFNHWVVDTPEINC